MSYYKSATIQTTYVPAISQALLWKVRNPGMINDRVECFLSDCIGNETDQRIISICEQFIDEIYDMRRNSYNGRWAWRHDAAYGSFEESYADLICEIVGCWLDYGTQNSGCSFYVNQNHQQWLSW